MAKSVKYPNLYKGEKDGSWVFRKYSKEKRREFRQATGIRDDEARAYRLGLEAFNKWLGRIGYDGGPVIISVLAKLVLESKSAKSDNHYRSLEGQIRNHIIPGFGHFRPDQITSLKWDLYDAEERRKGRNALYNTLKVLRMILNRARDEGIIPRAPKLINHDPEPRQGKYISETLFGRLITHATGHTRLLLEWMYYMGARPGEIIQYRWDMIDWEQGPNGTIRIPALITKNRRSREIPLNSEVSKRLIKVRHKTQSKFLFPSPHHPDRPIKEYRSGWEGTLRRTGIPISSYVIYDLRDTWVTNAAKRGVNIVYAAKYIDTSVEMIEKIYARSETDIMEKVAG